MFDFLYYKAKHHNTISTATLAEANSLNICTYEEADIFWMQLKKELKTVIQTVDSNKLTIALGKFELMTQKI